MPPPKQPNPYIKYSNIAVQMALTIGLSAWGGKKLDEHYQNAKPICTILLSLFGITAAMYLVLKDFIKPKK
ncbi:MAG: AtpZ/AtpI family protein [Sphingobacteriaceae bacterium]|nr:AtpZ/AtpI family protein [Sphingobacteriaceae bacterium]